MHGCAQAAHGGSGVQAVPADVADDEGDAGTGQGDHVEPVPTRSCMRRKVAVGGLHGVLLWYVVRQQAALQGGSHVVFAHIASCVVDANSGASGDFLGQCEVVLLFEGIRAPETCDAKHDSPRDQRDGDERMEPLI